MTRALSLALLLPLAACGSDTTETTTPEASGDTLSVVTESDTTDTSEAASGDARPATKQGTISIEGEAEPVTLTLVEEADFPLPFSTYTPEGVDFDWSASGEGAGARFTMGSGEMQSMVTVFVPGDRNADLDRWAQQAAESYGETSPLSSTLPWVESGYSFGGIDASGSVLVGRHAGVPFYVLTVTQVEMGDGFGPRAATILGEWRWADDGSGLGR